MKVKITTERECCHPEDFVTYRGESNAYHTILKPMFCKHCGQLWILERYTDAAGSRDSDYVKYIPHLAEGKR